MKKIVYKTESGISIITPAVSIELSMKDIPKDTKGKPIEHKIVEESEIPTSRTFRGAWGYDLKEDIVKVREIKKNLLRKDRDPLLKEQDILFMRALENGTDPVNVKAEKQRLRDITNLVDSASTLEEIKAITV